jgi:hypothetical protein
MIIGYLLFAHLIGDFVLQPKKLVLWKTKEQAGLFVHVLIHFFVAVLLLSPIIFNGNLWFLSVIFGLNFIHFWIDKIKVNYDSKHNNKVRSLLADQILHLLIIVLVFFAVGKELQIDLPKNTFYEYYSDIRLILTLCGLASLRAIYKSYTLNGSKL